LGDLPHNGNKQDKIKEQCGVLQIFTSLCCPLVAHDQVLQMPLATALFNDSKNAVLTVFTESGSHLLTLDDQYSYYLYHIMG
jgi:hypothetical protein